MLFGAYLLNKASEQVGCGIPEIGHIYPAKRKQRTPIVIKVYLNGVTNVRSHKNNELIMRPYLLNIYDSK